VAWLLAHACPPPHLVLVLDAPAEVLYARKGEHTVGKLESQRQAYRSLQTRLSNVTILDATREAEHVRRQANMAIWETVFRRRNSKGKAT